MEHHPVELVRKILRQLRRNLHGMLEDARHLGLDVLVLFELAAQLFRHPRRGVAQCPGDGLQRLLVARAVFAAEQEDGYAQHLRHFPAVDTDAVFLRFVRHVEQDHEVHVELLELQQQAHLAFDLRGVQYDERQIGHVVVNEMAHHLLVVGEAVQIVDARQVDDLDHVGAEKYPATEKFNGDAGPVADARGTARHAVEQGGLARVGHAQ